LSCSCTTKSDAQRQGAAVMNPQTRHRHSYAHSLIPTTFTCA
jgi:hypothetical protein